MNTWQDKANRIIGAQCANAWRQANAGKRKHIPYSVPSVSQELVECLGTNDEHKAKALFIKLALIPEMLTEG